MAPTMEQLSRRVAEWRISLLDEGLNVNAGKPKVMVDSSCGKMIVHSVESVRKSAGKLLSAQYVKSEFISTAMVYIGDLSLVVDGFKCK